MVEIDFRTTSLSDLVRSVRAKEVSARELTQAALDRIERFNPTYNAFVAVDAEQALQEAAAVDAHISGGGDPGPLAGIPIGVMISRALSASPRRMDRRSTPIHTSWCIPLRSGDP